MLQKIDTGVYIQTERENKYRPVFYLMAQSYFTIIVWQGQWHCLFAFVFFHLPRVSWIVAFIVKNNDMIIFFHVSLVGKLNSSPVQIKLKFKHNLFFFWFAPFGYLYFPSQWINQDLGAVINPYMALTPFPSSIGWDSNPRSSNRESSVLTTRPDFRPFKHNL